MYAKYPKNKDEADFKLAMQLIWGVEEWDENMVPNCSFLPRSAEREAYKALSRLLFHPKNKVPDDILGALSALFDPDRHDYPLMAVVKRRHRRPPPNEWRAYYISNFVDRLRRNGKSYDDATLAVAETLGKSQEHIKKLYGSDRGKSAK
jgi:hypothetical protein